MCMEDKSKSSAYNQLVKSCRMEEQLPKFMDLGYSSIHTCAVRAPSAFLPSDPDNNNNDDEFQGKKEDMYSENRRDTKGSYKSKEQRI